jgi:hypothetical protein
VIADSVLTYLNGLGVVSYTDGGDVWLGELPDDVDEALAAVDVPGPPPDPTEPYDRPSLQFLSRGARSAGPEAAHTRVQAIYDRLQGLTSTTLPDGTQVIWCRCMQSGPVSLGVDELQRWVWTLNFDVLIHHPTEHRAA